MLHLTWKSSLQQIDPDNRSLEELTKELEEEAKRSDPKHTRRVKILQIKRGSDSRSDFADRLKQEGTVIEFDKMSQDEFFIHLFVWEADSQIAKIALEIMERDKPSFHTLINKCKETESAVWYNNKKEFGRMANMRPQKYCKPCDSKTHNESEC